MTENTTHTSAQPGDEDPTVSESEPTLWSIRDYRLWFAGDIFTEVGVTLGAFAFSLIGYHVSHDVVFAGVMGTVSAASQAVAVLPGGIIADKVDRRHLLIGSGIAAFLIYAGLAATIVTGTITPSLLLGFAVFGGLAGGIFENLTDVILPNVVPQRLLPSAMAANQGRDAAITLGASPLAGFLFGLHPAIAFISAAVLRLGQTFAGLTIKTDLRPSRDLEAQTSFHMFGGFTWLARWQQPRVLALINVGVTFSLALCAMAVTLNLQQIGVESWQLGMVQAFQGAGLIIGAVALMGTTEKFTGGQIIPFSLLLIFGAFACALLTQNVWILAAIAFTASLPLIPLLSTQSAYMTLLIPEELRGRVLSVLTFATTLLATIAPTLSGILLKQAGYIVAVAAPVTLLGILVLLAICSPTVRAVPRKNRFENVTPLALG